MSGQGRLSAMPEVPTFREGGMPNFVVSAWQGIAVPKATPKQPIDRISKEVTAILGGTDVQEYLVKFGAELFISSPMETSALIQSDVAMNARIIKDAGITME
jgi:tripartite-type tricarboxylate transporter receptor subunit TctC